jgi:hypothetical protein
MDLIIGALVTFIVTLVITESYLFGWLRRGSQRLNRHLGVLFSCFLCLGIWVGFAVAWVQHYHLTSILGYGLAYQGLAYVIYTLVKLAEDARIRLQR